MPLLFGNKQTLIIHILFQLMLSEIFNKFLYDRRWDDWEILASFLTNSYKKRGFPPVTLHCEMMKCRSLTQNTVSEKVYY